MNNAMLALNTVPTTAMAAPNCSLMMSHSAVQRNFRPNALKVGHAFRNRDTIIPSSAASTSSEKACVPR